MDSALDLAAASSAYVSLDCLRTARSVQLLCAMAVMFLRCNAGHEVVMINHKALCVQHCDW